MGGSGVLVNLSVLWFLTETIGLYYIFSGLIAIESAIITNFILNDHWTWHGIGKRGFKHKLNRLIAFNMVCAVGMVISISILWILTNLGLNYMLSSVAGIMLAAIWNFTTNDNVTWKVDLN